MNTRTIAVVVALVSFLQIGIYQWTEIQSLRREVRLLENAKDILEDQTRELAMSVSNLTAESEASATRNFVLGVMAASKNPDYYNSVWHDGYDRGTQVQKQQQYTTKTEPQEVDPPR